MEIDNPTATVARHKGLPRITQDNALQFADMEIPSLKGLKKGSKSWVAARAFDSPHSLFYWQIRGETWMGEGDDYTADVTKGIRRYGMAFANIRDKYANIREHSREHFHTFATHSQTFAEVDGCIRTHSHTFAHIRGTFAHIRAHSRIRAHSHTFAHIRARAPQIRRRYANIREQVYRDSHTFTTGYADPR